MSFPTRQQQIYYNQKFKKEFDKPKNVQAVAVLVMNAAAIATVASASHLIITSYRGVGLALYPLSIWIIGTRFRAFINIVHECVHNAFAQSIKLNAYVGELLCTVLMISYADYRHHHATHHMNTGDYTKDLDFLNSQHYEFHVPLDRALLRKHIGRIFTGAVLKDYIGNVIYDRKASRGWRAARASYSLSLALIISYEIMAQGTSYVLLYVIIPRFVALPVIGYLSDLFDHGGVLGQKDDLDKSRNYIVDNPLVRMLCFPRNDCYHLLHHLFPMVPVKNFPDAHRILMEEQPEYAVKPHRFSQWMRAPFTTTSPINASAL